MYASFGLAPSTRAMRRPRPTGESQMPMTRSPRWRLIASVTRPAGLVKLMTQASGARVVESVMTTVETPRALESRR